MTVREGMAVTIDGEVSLTLKRESEMHVMLSIGTADLPLKLSPTARRR
jgi:hypothetical protein